MRCWSLTPAYGRTWVQVRGQSACCPIHLTLCLLYAGDTFVQSNVQMGQTAHYKHTLCVIKESAWLSFQWTPWYKCISTRASTHPRLPASSLSLVSSNLQLQQYLQITPRNEASPFKILLLGRGLACLAH